MAKRKLAAEEAGVRIWQVEDFGGEAIPGDQLQAVAIHQLEWSMKGSC